MVSHLLKLVVVAAITASTAAVAQEATKFEQIQLAQVTQPTAYETVREQATDAIGAVYKTILLPFISEKDIDCLARNIFYESGAEPTEGKIAVGLVTINRAQDGRFGKTVCEVVKARTVVAKTREVHKTEMVKVGFFGPPEKLSTKQLVTEQIPVCQFSWVCGGYARKPKADDERWIESRQIAEGLARGEYEEYKTKYGTALFFHSTAVRPVWAKAKKYVTKTGHHLFYE